MQCTRSQAIACICDQQYHTYKNGQCVVTKWGTSECCDGYLLCAQVGEQLTYVPTFRYNIWQACICFITPNYRYICSPTIRSNFTSCKCLCDVEGCYWICYKMQWWFRLQHVGCLQWSIKFHAFNSIQNCQMPFIFTYLSLLTLSMIMECMYVKLLSRRQAMDLELKYFS